MDGALSINVCFLCSLPILSLGSHFVWVIKWGFSSTCFEMELLFLEYSKVLEVTCKIHAASLFKE